MIYQQCLVRYSNLNSMISELDNRTDLRTNAFTKHFKTQHAIILVGILSNSLTMKNVIKIDPTNHAYRILLYEYVQLQHKFGRLTCKMGRAVGGFPLKYDEKLGIVPDDD